MEIFVHSHRHINSHSFGLDLGNVLESCVVRASLIGSSNKHRDRNLLDVANRNHVRCALACQPVLVRNGLLEAICDIIFVPVQLRLDGLALLTCHISVKKTDLFVEVVADGLQVPIPVGTVVSVDPIIF